MRLALLLSIATMLSAQEYVLRDAERGIEVRVAPAKGMNASAMSVHGKPVLAPQGIPVLWPWANRLDGEVYWANGREYRLNPALKNYHLDGKRQPIHGLIERASEWKVTSADDSHVTARLEFWRYPAWMAQFPFAHNLEITYRLRDGALEVETVIANLSAEPMPVALGFHPYFQLSDAPRDEWKVHLAAREQIVLTPTLVPTGERRANPYSDPLTLKGFTLDDVFSSLVRDSDGMARFWVQGREQRVTVEFGPHYNAAVVFAPPGSKVVCFEPMAAITNAFNLAQAGKYAELQTIAPGGTWSERFVIRATGF